MDKVEKLKLIISLVLAKLEIQKMKAQEGGYTYSHVCKEDQASIEKTLVDIDELLNEVRNG